MCLLLFAINSHSEYRLLIAANRDEFYERQTAVAGFWKKYPYMIAGMDLKAGGTWLGMTRKGKVAAVTNFRDPASYKENAASRGNLVKNYLLGSDNPVEYIEHKKGEAEKYNGFNLVCGDIEKLYCFSNRSENVITMSHGIYGLSNALLDSPWPKVIKGKEFFERAIGSRREIEIENFFRFLLDQSVGDDHNLPDTGVGLEKERMLSPIFIKSPDYGTRSSTLILVNRKNHVKFIERNYDLNSDLYSQVKYEFDVIS